MPAVSHTSNSMVQLDFRTKSTFKCLYSYDKFINGCTVNHGCSYFSRKIFADYFLTELENKVQSVEVTHTGPPTTNDSRTSPPLPG